MPNRAFLNNFYMIITLRISCGTSYPQVKSKDPHSQMGVMSSNRQIGNEPEEVAPKRTENTIFMMGLLPQMQEDL
jgi:hypothetical protein